MSIAPFYLTGLLYWEFFSYATRVLKCIYKVLALVQQSEHHQLSVLNIYIYEVLDAKNLKNKFGF